MQQTECGLCCVAMIAGKHNANYSLRELREMSGTGRDGVTLYHLVYLSKKIGFESNAYKLKVEQLDQIVLPAIAFWNNNHYVVIDKIAKNHIHIIDSAVGRRRIKKEDFINSYSGYILEMKPTESIQRIPKEPVWTPFLKYLTNKPMLIFTVLFVAAIFYLSVLGVPFLVQYLIDHIITKQRFQLLNTFIIAALILVLAQGLLQLGRGQLIIKLNNHLDLSMMKDFFSHLLKLPYQFFQLRSFGDLLYRASSIRAIREMMSSQIVLGVLDFAAILFVFGYMYIKSPFLAILVFLLSSLGTGFMLFNRIRLKEVTQNEIAKSSQLQSYQTEILYGIFGIKTAGIEKETYSRWEKYLNDLISAHWIKDTYMNFLNSITTMLQTISPLIILWIGAIFLQKGELTLGELVAFHALSSQFFAMSNSVVQTISSLLIATTYLNRIQDVLKSPIEQKLNNGLEKPTLHGKIELKDVSFQYTPHSELIVQDINLIIEPGQKIAIVGKSGSGKSTLAKLLLGLYVPTSGTIAYDDLDLKNIDLSFIRRQMGVVPQDVTLFNRSIVDNISLYSTDIDMERIIQVSKMAQIYEDIDNMPMKFETIASEQGMNLSGGQRQRIALARALINNPMIMLLDEATSSLDHQNERKIDEYLRSLNCTRIVIAHKLTSIMDSDVIIVLDKGRIQDVGKHEQLLNSNSFYHEFYQKFTLEEENLYVGGIV